jgi:hypothetical protein
MPGDLGGLDDRSMTDWILLCASIGVPLGGLGLFELQARLERWDYNRHAED